MTRRGPFVRILALLILAVPVAPSFADLDEVPPAFAPFDYVIGGWKGTARPAAQRVRGWNETHRWAWKFEKGKPVGLSIEIEGGKILKKANLSHDAATSNYTLAGTDAAGKPVTFKGSLGKDGKTLVLDRQGASPEGKERLTIRPNSNKVRYTMLLDRQEPGAPQFKNAIDIGVTKEGETFAAGGGGDSNLPKCILTGGAASMTVTYQGVSYPVCCTGCRDAFNDEPERFIAKAKKMAAQAAASGDTRPKASATSKDDGGFDGLVGDTKPASKTMTKPAAKSAGKTAAEPKSEAAAPAASKAAREFKIAQNLEKSGKTAAALAYYRSIVKSYPNTPEAKSAAARIEALK